MNTALDDQVDYNTFAEKTGDLFLQFREALEADKARLKGTVDASTATESTALDVPTT